MAFINDLEIAELQKSLTTRETANEIIANFLPLLRNSFGEVPHENASNRRQDLITTGLLPEGFKSWIPLSSKADGNCLFNSASILLIGNETFSGILRLLTVAELFANSDFYADHPQIAEFSQASGYSKWAIFNILLSDDSATKMFAGNPNNASRAIECLAKVSAKPYVFSSQFHILALASVIGRPIFSVYPHIPGAMAIKNAFHRICYPRESFMENSSLFAADPVYIMWTRANISPLRGWTPNHFAPLVPKAHESSSYAEVVARGRKRMQKFSFEKKNENTAYSRENTPPLEKKQPYTTPPSKSQQKTQHTKQELTKTLPDNQQQQKPSSKRTKPQQTTLSKKPQQQQTSLSKTPQQQPRSLFEKQDHPTNKDQQKRTMLPEKQQQRKTVFPKKQHQQKTTLREEQQPKKMFPNDQGQRSTFLKKQQQAKTLPQRTISTAQHHKPHFKGEKASEKAYVFSKPIRYKRKRDSKKQTPLAEKKPSFPPKISTFFESQKPTKDLTEDVHKRPETPPAAKDTNDQNPLFPLVGPDIDWYKEKGTSYLSNISRSQEPLIIWDDENLKYVALGSVKGSIKENIDELLQKLNDAGSEKQQQHFEAMIILGNYILEKGPIVSTQSLATRYREIKGSTAKRITSSRILRTMAKHLNVAQIYINGVGYILPNPGKTILDLFGYLENINKVDEKIIKEKVKDVIGDDFKIICEYMDSKRDKDTLKAILTKITSATFMAKLADVQDKRTFQRAKNQVDMNIEVFKKMKDEVEAIVERNDEAGRRKKYRLLQKMKLEKLRHVFKGRGRMLKCEEFPDLAAIMEYAFGESDRIERAGGGLESHPRLTDTILYRAADSNTIMKDARETILALAPDEFNISLSSCFNYTQNYKEGTYQAKRHHSGRGINACISLHKPPRIGVEKFVVNLRWSTHNVNLSMDFAHVHSNNVMIDSKDAKAKVQADVSPVQKPAKTWRKIILPDHDWSALAHNSVTPMTHLFMETELSVEELTEEERHYTVKRTGAAAILINLSHFEPETIHRAFNEIFLLLANPALDKYFRNPETGKLKEHFIFVVDNGPSEAPSHPTVKMWLVRLLMVLQLKSVTQKSFAEYHSKRNPVERVHAVENRALSNEVFSSTGVHKEYEKGDQQHLENMEFMAGQVERCLKKAQYGGRPIVTQRGIGKEDNFVFDDEDQLLTFLSRSEKLKNENNEHYCPKQNKLWQEVALIWDLNANFVGCYRDDYQRLENTFDEEGEQTCWATKYSTTVINPDSLEDYKEFLVAQPIPDYVRWFKTEELHYIPLEKLHQLNTDVIDSTPGAFLPSKILDMTFKLFRHDIESIIPNIALLCWCTEDEVKQHFSNFSDKLDKSFENDREREYWRHHNLYKTKDKAQLKRECQKNKLSPEGKKHQIVRRLVESLKLPLPPPLKKYDGNMESLPPSITELSQTPIFKLREILRYHNVLDCGTKDELAIRVSMVISGNANLAFKREYFAIKNILTATRTLIQRQKRMYFIDPKVISTQREFSTPSNPILSTSRPRDSASVFSKKKKASISIPFGISLETLDDIFEPIDREVSLYSDTLISQDRENKELNIFNKNLQAIRSVGANVLALWSKDEIGDSGWKSGWYRAKVLKYEIETDTVELEFDVEDGAYYQYIVKDEVRARRLKLAKDTQTKVNEYENIFQIGAVVEISWSKNDVVETNLVPGWHEAEVQSFDRDDDEIDVVLTNNTEWTYTIPVLPKLISGQLRLKQQLF